MKRLTVIIILLSAIIFSSCGSSAVVVRERPVAPVVVRPISPGAGYVWVDGNYYRSGRNYIYRPGYWSAPPRGRVVYKQGYWAPRGNGYYWHKGRW